MEKISGLNEKLRIVVFCGGFGTRMWPMSRRKFPKQFQPLLEEHSFFQDAISRAKLGFRPEDIYISVPEEQKKLVEAQASEIPQKNIIAEPERRDTLGAVAYVTAFLDKYFPNSLMAVVWGADHLVKERERFNEVLYLAAKVCQEKGAICMIDVKPAYPTTALGWIKVGKIISRVNGHRVYEFLKFVEKPNSEKAQKMFKNKGYLLNTGYFVWRTSTMLGLLKKYNPECFEHIAIIRRAFGAKDEEAIIKREYQKIEKTSIDFGLLEKLPPGSQLVISADIGWHDVGTWGLLYEALARGQRENVTRGEVKFIDSHGNLVYLTSHKIAALIGAENLIVIDTPDGLLVCRRNRGEEVKTLVDQLREEGKEKYL